MALSRSCAVRGFLGNPRGLPWRMAAVVVGALAVALAGCGEPAEPPVNLPQPPAVAGFFALEFERVAPPRFSSLASDVSPDIRASVVAGPIVTEGVRLEATGNSGYLAVGDQVFIHAEFELHNETDGILAAPHLLGYSRAEFRVGTAISQAVRSGGAVAPDWMVREIRPTHQLSYDGTLSGSPEALTGREFASSFVAFAEEDVPGVDQPFSLTVFPYGFRFPGGSIWPGDSARVSVGFAIPKSASYDMALHGFVWNAVLMAAGTHVVAQAPEENHARGWQAVLDRARRSGAEAIVAIGPGERLVDDPTLCDRLVGLSDVRIAGNDTTDADYLGLVSPKGPPQFIGCEGATP